mmetsp:Transcript_10924/g.20546  ORF Transcript_10924/g.20546 Transcript_10924/m.20546 type:complete len:589 (+) Transcript_10924:148-1914(+)
MTFHGLRTTIATITEATDFKASGKMQTSLTCTVTALMLAALLFFCVLADVSSLVFAFIGAAVYATFRSQPLRKRAQPARPDKVASEGKNDFGRRAHSRSAQQQQKPGGLVQKLRPEKSKPDSPQATAVPIVPPTFRSTGWSAEVDELIAQISNTASGDQAVDQLAQLVQQIIRPILPQVEVVGFASGNFERGKAFGVAVPEVDIIASINPAQLPSQLQSRGPKSRGVVGRDDALHSDPKKLQKWAIRACTDRLVAAGNFKFRRSAFRGQEPKVTLLACADMFSEAIPIDFSVNTATPFYSAALLTECGQIESRAKALILLAKRWAKDRGICHAPKGHLTPYAWSLLAIYFLQVRAGSEGSLLPPLQKFAASSCLMTRKGSISKPALKSASPAKDIEVPCADVPAASTAESTDEKMSVGSLFKEFVRFYHSEFNWREEAVSVRLGSRAAPDVTLPFHIIVKDDGCSSEVGPSVEDPFEVSRNLAAHMTADSLCRLHAEFARADALCAREASLTELLELWCPPALEAKDAGCKDYDDETRHQLQHNRFGVRYDSKASTRVPSESSQSSPPRSPPPTPPRVSPRSMPGSPQ